MTFVRDLLRSRWTLSFIGVAILALLVWFFGPLIAALAGIPVRAAVVVLLLVIWLGANYCADRRRRKKDDTLVAGVAKPAASETDALSAAERAALSGKLTQALSLLRRASGRRGYLYEQPWYVIIGPPGAGKTTALLNSGLKFPLAAEMGQGAVAGVGGTRLCDWWFTEEAALIDTAGRYTTQDSDAAVDRAGWEQFLDLLRRTRGRQALNGVIVAIAISDIAAAPADERLAHARAIRKRVKEIAERLALRVPIYAVFTKADLIAGFTEFFDDLDQARRAQVWGVTFDLGARDPAGPAAGFAADYRGLVERLDKRLIDRLQGERSPERRAILSGFPAQMASLADPLDQFLQEAFGGSTLDPAPFLRGAYFTSGTQEGTPLDRLTGVLARDFGIDQLRVANLRPQSGRSYFLSDLLRKVVFKEAMLAAVSPAVRRRRLGLRIAGFAAIGIAFALLLSGLIVSRVNNQAMVAANASAVKDYDRLAASLPLDPVRDANLSAVLPLLEKARALADGADYSARRGGTRIALDQAPHLQAADDLVYRKALDRVMLPRLIVQLEAEMRGGFDRPEFLYQATRVYLMLGGRGPLDQSLVEAWERLDWERLYPGAIAAPMRQDLMRNLVALLSAPLPPIELDGALVEAARATFSRVSIAARVYSRIRDSARAAAPAPWTPAAAMGSAGTGLFLRASGKPLTEGVPGFYTKAGFYTVLLPALTHAAKDVADESWVLGRNQRIDPAGTELANLEQNVIRLYETDYEHQWDALLGDLDLAPLRDPGHAVQALYILSSPQSPIQKLLVALADQVSLAKSPPASAAQKLATALPGAAKLSQASAQLQGLIGTPAAAAATPPGSEVEAYYAPLLRYIGNGGSGSPLALTLGLLNSLQQQLAALAGPASAAAPGADAAGLLQGDAERDPQPVARWMQRIAASANTLRGGSAAKAAASAFNGAGGPAQLCQQAVKGRYPFDRTSKTDIPLADFSRLFAPGGQLDAFFGTQIKPYVDMSGPAWRIQAVNGVVPPVSQGALREFQRAETIRQVFFANGATPSVQFSITPMALDEGAAKAALQLGPLMIAYAHGAAVPTEVSWPGPSGMQSASLTITPATGEPVALQSTGPWALFRLIELGSLRQDGASNRYRLTFDIGGHQAGFELEAGSVFNPFSTGVLHDFRCPSLQG